MISGLHQGLEEGCLTQGPLLLTATCCWTEVASSQGSHPGPAKAKAGQVCTLSAHKATTHCITASQLLDSSYRLTGSPPALCAGLMLCSFTVRPQSQSPTTDHPSPAEQRYPVCVCVWLTRSLTHLQQGHQLLQLIGPQQGPIPLMCSGQDAQAPD